MFAVPVRECRRNPWLWLRHLRDRWIAEAEVRMLEAAGAGRESRSFTSTVRLAGSSRTFVYEVVTVVPLAAPPAAYCP